MKITKTLQLAVLLGAIGLSSCSRVYTSRNYVKVNESAKATEKEAERKQIQIDAIANQVPDAFVLAQTPAASENLMATTVPFTFSKKETKAAKNSVTLPVEVTSGLKIEKKAEAPKVKEQGTAVPVPKDKTGEKSQLIALILCGVVGYLGIHRFYLGYTGIGIIQLLTLGGCGIWTLIDFIMIITGDLQPKNGSYDKTFDDM